MSNYLMYGLGALAAFFGFKWLAGRDDANANADAAQAASAQPQLPMFVSGGFGGGFGGGGFGGGSGVAPALPAASFPELPASSFNFPEAPQTNQNDVAIAEYNYRAQLDSLKYEDKLARLSFDILKYGVENPVTGNVGASGADEGYVGSLPKDEFRRVTPKIYDSPKSNRPSAGGVIDYQGPALTIIPSSGPPKLSSNEVRRLFQTNSTSAAEYKLYDRAKQTGASNREIANLLNRSGIAQNRVFSTTDVENWKYERGL